jgi:3-deoxy-D-manno-octulosonic-acid transferase
VALGAAPQSVTVAGSVKFDVPVESLRKQQQQLRQHLAISPERPILLAASTHRGEDGWVIDAFLQVLQAVPNALLLLAPRHPERCHEVSALLTNARLAWRLRSQQNPVLPSDQVLLVDTLGELGAMTGLAQIAFIGGSLVTHGGHNPLEAAAFGVPTLTGPHRFNFGDIFSDLLVCGGALEVSDANGLGRAWLQWLQNPESAQKAGRAAEIYLQKNKGALDAQYALLETHIRGSASVD